MDGPVDNSNSDVPQEPNHCWAKRKNCKKCEYRYTLADKDLESCPVCGRCRRCRLPKMIGKERCRWHGGKTPVGKAAHQWKTGEKSKYDHLPIDIQRRIERLVSDKELFSLEREVIVTMARTLELEERLNQGENIGLWKALEKHSKELRTVLGALDSTNDPDVLQQLASQRDLRVLALLDVIEQGAKRDKTWDDLLENAERTSKIKEAHSRMRKEAQTMVAIEEVGNLILALQAVIQKRISDKDTIMAIGDDIRRLMNKRDPMTVDALPAPKK